MFTDHSHWALFCWSTSTHTHTHETVCVWVSERACVRVFQSVSWGEACHHTSVTSSMTNTDLLWMISEIWAKPFLPHQMLWLIMTTIFSFNYRAAELKMKAYEDWDHIRIWKEVHRHASQDQQAKLQDKRDSSSAQFHKPNWVTCINVGLKMYFKNCNLLRLSELTFAYLQ